MTDEIKLDFEIIKNILTQLTHSDGMEVTNDYLIKQKIYYIDNVGLIEELETLTFEQFYDKIRKEKGNVNLDELLNKFQPMYINYDKLYNTLEKKYNKTDDDLLELDNKKKSDNTLNKYF